MPGPSASPQDQHATVAYVAPYSLEVKAFPNPTSGLVTISFEANRDLREAPSVLVSNMQGQVVARAQGLAEGKSWSAVLDLRSYGPGVFLLRTNCKECPVHKIVVTDIIAP